MKSRKLKAMAVTLVLTLLLGVIGQAETLESAGGSIADVYERVSPAVLQVRNIIETWTQENGAVKEVAAYASGVYIEEGYVLTNWSAIYEADEIEIETLDGRIVYAKDTFVDESVDLAVLELEEPLEGIEPVELGDSESLRPGELSIVIGNPVLLERVYPGTVTAGIISGVKRSSEGMGYFNRSVPLIQLDAALNMGSSGGGLFNLKGELIGLTTLKAGLVDEMLYEGMSFAIPAETIRRVAGDLVAYGVVRRPRMGIMVSDLDGPEEPIRNYPPQGLMVSEIDETGPAAQAGMMLYDVIMEFDGVRVHNFTELSALIDQHEAGDTVHVLAYRCLDDEGYMIDDPQYVEFDIELGILD